jgi:hypothetical protein
MKTVIAAMLARMIFGYLITKPYNHFIYTGPLE